MLLLKFVSSYASALFTCVAVQRLQQNASLPPLFLPPPVARLLPSDGYPAEHQPSPNEAEIDGGAGMILFLLDELLCTIWVSSTCILRPSCHLNRTTILVHISIKS
jgi:hypothetical protein